MEEVRKDQFKSISLLKNQAYSFLGVLIQRKGRRNTELIMRAPLVAVSALVCLLSACQSSENVSKRSKIIPSRPLAKVTEPPVADLVVVPSMSSEESTIKVNERQLLVEGKPFTMKAVCWNPVRKGQKHPEGLIFRNPNAEDLQIIDQDLRMMQELGVNTVRSYEPILDDRVLSLLRRYKLRTIVPVLNYYATADAEIVSRIQKLKNHPTTLIWEIGNEWNYNQFYSVDSAAIGFEGSKNLVKKTALLIRSLDRNHPISTVYGELPPLGLINELVEIDIWGLNIYSGLSFGTRFQAWRELSSKPMYLAEYGADAINRTVLDEASQAKGVAALTTEITQNLSATSASLVSLGGAVFEWNDEWWKDPAGTADRQDIGGIAPGSGPYPDMIFNEEWWGIVDIDRKPRAVFQELKKIWNPDDASILF